MLEVRVEDNIAVFEDGEEVGVEVELGEGVGLGDGQGGGVALVEEAH